MPLIVRQALAQRLLKSPELLQLLRDVRTLTGVEVSFHSAMVETSAIATCAPLCLYLERQRGCQMCSLFHHKMREEAVREPCAARCDGGLWEIWVPVMVGGQGVGHLLVAGLAEGEEGAREVNRARHLLARQGVDLTGARLEELRRGAPRWGAAQRESLGRLLRAVAEQVERHFTEQMSRPIEVMLPLVEQAYHIVHADYAKPLRVPRLAERLGVSGAHLSRTFHRATGLRLVDYIARYRAERAKQLLLSSERPVGVVARECGFTSVSQFHRVFRATYGQAPLAVRKGLPLPVRRRG